MLGAHDPRKRPNRRLYIEKLRRMTPEERLRKALELTDEVRELTRAGDTSSTPASH